MTARLLERWAGGWRFFVIAVTPVFVVASFAVWFTFVRVPTFDPLTFSPQRVERIEPGTGVITVPKIDGFPGPAVYVGEDVPVSGTLVVEAKETVELIGSVLWSSREPNGLRCVVLDKVPAVREPGVYVLHFENQMPDCVKDIMETRQPTRWVISGAVVPQAPGGVAAAWQTEEFWVVHKDFGSREIQSLMHDGGAG